MIANNKVENMQKEEVATKFEVVSGQFPGITEGNCETPQDIRMSGRDSIRATPGYKSEILSLERNLLKVAT
jgi:hypothetical protein